MMEKINIIRRSFKWDWKWNIKTSKRTDDNDSNQEINISSKHICLNGNCSHYDRN
jgi:hypothetical protein